MVVKLILVVLAVAVPGGVPIAAYYWPKNESKPEEATL